MDQPDLAARREQARLLYVDTNLTTKEIGARLGVAKGSISVWASRYDWPRRSPGNFSRASLAGQSSTPETSASAACQGQSNRQPDLKPGRRRRKRPPIKNIVDRLYHIINHNLELMETRMSDDKPAGDNNPERDMRAISSVVRSVDKLKEIEPEQSKRHNASSGSTGYPLITAEEEDRIRRKVVEHILKLRERKRGDGGDRSSG